MELSSSQNFKSMERKAYYARHFWRQALAVLMSFAVGIAIFFSLQAAHAQSARPSEVCMTKSLDEKSMYYGAAPTGAGADDAALKQCLHATGSTSRCNRTPICRENTDQYKPFSCRIKVNGWAYEASGTSIFAAIETAKYNCAHAGREPMESCRDPQKVLVEACQGLQ